MGYRPTANGLVNRDGGYIRFRAGPRFNTPEEARVGARELLRFADELERLHRSKGRVV
jgi:hypothetical protein